ncbi:hypothetical protein CYMTET_50945 [Cymbomonas tetramitiformis]|uniref:Uncharacterized protein n=1 Tax=Cymbomonas tetramitiformis TaxID=36881 RepID=A0AAE0ESB2_9CHLO|nr:hypothetical protein CYMTET_50945 [Cymbomonas tetramitiformis]
MPLAFPVTQERPGDGQSGAKRNWREELDPFVEQLGASEIEAPGFVQYPQGLSALNEDSSCCACYRIPSYEHVALLGCLQKAVKDDAPPRLNPGELEIIQDGDVPAGVRVLNLTLRAKLEKLGMGRKKARIYVQGNKQGFRV